MTETALRDLERLVLAREMRVSAAAGRVQEMRSRIARLDALLAFTRAEMQQRTAQLVEAERRLDCPSRKG